MAANGSWMSISFFTPIKTPTLCCRTAWSATKLPFCPLQPTTHACCSPKSPHCFHPNINRKWGLLHYICLHWLMLKKSVKNKAQQWHFSSLKHDSSTLQTLQKGPLVGLWSSTLAVKCIYCTFPDLFIYLFRCGMGFHKTLVQQLCCNTD